MGGTDTPLSLLNGEVFARSNQVQCSREICERIEAAAFGNQRLLEANILSLLDAERDGEATRVLNEWVSACTDSHLAVLDR